MNSIINIETNKSFCTSPWSDCYSGCKYEKKLCCLSKDLEGYDKVPLKDFWNSKKMREIRTKMLKGEKIPECQECYDNEKIKVKSLRQLRYYNSVAEEIVKNTDESGYTSIKPSTFDYRTLSCNLQCISCGSEYSSKHNTLRKKMWGAEDYFKSDPIFEKTLSTDIIKSLRNKECKSIYWAGGEPMLSSVHWDVIEEISKLKRNPEYKDYLTQFQCHYNSNMTLLHVNKKNIPKELEFFQPMIQASIDGTHETLEYLRDGAKWNEVEHNWKEYFKYLNKNKQMSISPVLSAPMLMDIDRYLDFFEPFDPILYSHKYISNRINYPSGAAMFLDIKLYPKDIANRILDNAIKRFTKSNLRQKELTLNILRHYKEDVNTPNIAQDIIKEIKEKTLYRDKFQVTKRPFSDLLKIIDKEAYNWYINI